MDLLYNTDVKLLHMKTNNDFIIIARTSDKYIWKSELHDKNRI